MKKLKLESLEVTSFETHSQPADRGTVVGNGAIKPLPPTGPFGPTACMDCPTNPDFDCTYGCTHVSIRDDCAVVQP